MNLNPHAVVDETTVDLSLIGRDTLHGCGGVFHEREVAELR
jgi:hypothetical protein